MNNISQNKGIILTDSDGVLVNWDDSFNKFMKSNNMIRVPNTDTKFSTAQRYGLSQDEAMSYVREFNNSEHIANLDPLLDSVEYVKKLSQLGFRFVVISSLGDSNISKKYREKNLKQLFGDIFDDIHCIDLNKSKEELLSNWKNSRNFWIEDHPDNATIGANLGLNSLLIRHVYNSEFTTSLFKIIDSPTPWRVIFEDVCKAYNLHT